MRGEYRRKAKGSQGAPWDTLLQDASFRLQCRQVHFNRPSPRTGMPSFDVVSELDSHEVTNAVDQANRELSQRFDFKDTGAVYELLEHTVTLKAEVDFQLKQMLHILKL